MSQNKSGTEDQTDPVLVKRFADLQTVFAARTVNGTIHDCKEASCTIAPNGTPIVRNPITGALSANAAKRPPLDPAIIILATELGV